MINKLWKFIFRKKLKSLDGHKTTIGAIMTVLGAVATLASNLFGIYPDSEILSKIAGTLPELLDQGAMWLERLGLTVMSLGLVDKVNKDEN